MASRLQGPCVVSEMEKALSYKSKAFRDDSITRGGGSANFPKHLQAFKGTPAVSWNMLRPDSVDPWFLFTFKTRVLFSLSCTYSWSFLTNIPRLVGRISLLTCTWEQNIFHLIICAASSQHYYQTLC